MDDGYVLGTILKMLTQIKLQQVEGVILCQFADYTELHAMSKKIGVAMIIHTSRLTAKLSGDQKG